MVETESEETKVPFPLVDLEVRYGPHKKGWGVLLNVKAPEWEKLFSKISNGKIIHWKRDGVEADFYDFPLAENESSFYEFVPSGQYLTEDPPGGRIMTNLSPLRMVGVGEGVEVFFSGIFENDLIKKFCARVGDRSQVLYRKLSPGSMKMKVWLDDWKVGERVVR